MFTLSEYSTAGDILLKAYKRWPNLTIYCKILATAFFCLNTVAASDIKSVSSSPSFPYLIDVPFDQYLHVYDWDETVLNMPSQVKLFSKTSDDILFISNGDFAINSKKIGSEAPYADYEIRGQVPGGSFDESQLTGPNSLFKKTLEKAVQSPESEWQGPAFWNWVKDLQTAEGARRVYTLSARGHLPKEWHEGYKVLKDFLLSHHNIKIFLPPIANSSGVGGGRQLAIKKSNRLAQLIDTHANANILGLIYFEDNLPNATKARELFAYKTKQLRSFNARVEYVGISAEPPSTNTNDIQLFQAYKLNWFCKEILIPR